MPSIIEVDIIKNQSGTPATAISIDTSGNVILAGGIINEQTIAGLTTASAKNTLLAGPINFTGATALLGNVRIV